MSDRVDLEDAIQDAFYASEAAHLALAVGLGFENKQAPVLTEEQASIVYWCITDLSAKVRACHQAFYAGDEVAS